MQGVPLSAGVVEASAWVLEEAVGAQMPHEPYILVCPSTDPAWVPLITTPSHPEYPAGHPSQNGAAATVLLRQFGRRQTFTLTTTGQPSRTYTSIAQARSDGDNARVWGGMHYPSTVRISDALGEAIATYVDRNSMIRLRGGNDDEGNDKRR